MHYSNEWLLKQLEKGYDPNYLLFWGHRPLPNGKIGRSCLSQWFAAGFTHEGVYYPTAEHWMMAIRHDVHRGGRQLPQIFSKSQIT